MLLQTVKNRGRWHLFLTPRSIWKTEEDRTGFCGCVIRIKEESLEREKQNLGSVQIWQGLQELIKAKKELEELGRKSTLHISFELRIKYKHYMEV